MILNSIFNPFPRSDSASKSQQSNEKWNVGVALGALAVVGVVSYVFQKTIKGCLGYAIGKSLRVYSNFPTCESSLGSNRLVKYLRSLGTGQECFGEDLFFEVVKPFTSDFTGALSWMPKKLIQQNGAPGCQLIQRLVSYFTSSSVSSAYPVFEKCHKFRSGILIALLTSIVDFLDSRVPEQVERFFRQVP